MRRSYLLILLCFPAFFLFSTGCGKTPNYWSEAKPNQKKILVSFPPLYAITVAVAGDDAYVLSMLTSRGPHGYDGAATDLLKVKHADLFIFNGLTLDDQFVDRMLQNHANKSLVVLNVGKDLEKEHERIEKEHAKHKKEHDHKKGPAHKDEDHDEDLLIELGHHHEHKAGEKHDHGTFDPHVWLGPKQAIAMTRIIAKELAEIDPSKKKNYDERAEKFIKELNELQEYGETAFKGVKNRQFITQHESLGYFAQAFDLKIVGSIQKTPGLDPDSVTTKELIKLIRQPNGPRVIAVEPQYSKAPAEALQKTLKDDGIQVKIVTLDPLETADIAAGKNFNPDPGYYLKGMRANIDALAKALQP